MCPSSIYSQFIQTIPTIYKLSINNIQASRFSLRKLDILKNNVRTVKDNCNVYPVASHVSRLGVEVCVLTLSLGSRLLKVKRRNHIEFWAVKLSRSLAHYIASMWLGSSAPIELQLDPLRWERIKWTVSATFRSAKISHKMKNFSENY